MPQVVEGPRSLRVAPGDPAEFTVLAKGKGLTYQWWHGGARIPGATSPTYRIASVGASDFGDYAVDVTRGDDTRGVFADLVQIGAPEILSESREEPVDGRVTMSVVAEGDPAPSYQWVEEVGTALPVPVPGGTGPSLTVPVPTRGAATYWVYATNAKGSEMGSPNLVQSP